MLMLEDALRRERQSAGASLEQAVADLPALARYLGAEASVASPQPT